MKRLALFLWLLAVPAAAELVETRAFEIRLENSWTLQGVRNAVNRAADMGLNCVRVETFYHGSTIYPSAVMASYGLPAMRPSFGPGPNALPELIRTAHARGMTVYAWVETFYVWNNGFGGPGAILTKYPSWSIRNADGTMLPKQAETAYYYISPANLEARAFLNALYAEIANTGVDGLFVDYLRYPRGALGPQDAISYDDASKQRALAELGLDITTVPLDTRNADFQRWTLWRQQQTTDAAKDLAAAVHTANPSAVFCATVHPGYNPDWRTHDSLRDWPAWQPDVPVFSMQYYTGGNPPSASDVAWQEGLMDTDLAAAAPRTLLWPAVKTTDITTGAPLLGYVRTQPYAGISYWVYSALTAADGDALISGPFTQPSLPGETMPIRAARLLVEGARAGLPPAQQAGADRALEALAGPDMRGSDAAADVAAILAAGGLDAGVRRDLDLAQRLLNLAPATLARGDADRDGAVTVLDAARTARWLAGPAPALSRDGADADGDGRITLADAAASLRTAAGL